MNIGFVSTRFAGVDGVSLEANKWADVLEQNGHRCFWFAGELDHPAGISYLATEAHFNHKYNQWINQKVFGHRKRAPEVTELIHSMRVNLKGHLHRFLNQFQIDLLIAENALTIPMNIPLGLALTETISETQVHAIAHHHDFYWERTRFALNSVGEYLQMGFPPKLPNIEHVVINSTAREELAHRTGLSSTVIPNVLNYDSPPSVDEARGKAFREYIGLSDQDILVLQPTRVIQRKGIEHAIELVRQLAGERVKLVISHEAGDEGYEYADWIEENAKQNGVDLRMVKTGINDPILNGSSDDHFSLWDVYAQADLVTYPSLCEGFGNAFLEAVYWKKPILINRYANFVKDIEPLGFDLMVMDGFLKPQTVAKVKALFANGGIRKEMVEHNYHLARKHFSYRGLCRQMSSILGQLFGSDSYQMRYPVAESEDVVYLKPFPGENDNRVYQAACS
jgi:glycosyltransferase involved in cell wall biosynthesis